MRLTLIVAITLAVGPWARAQDADPVAPAVRITDKLRRDAAAVAPLVSAGLAKEFLAATARLVEPTARVVYRDRERGIALTPAAYQALGGAERETLVQREFPPEFYYETAYGSPLVYARLLDLVAPHLERGARPRLLDFGYGTIGHLQLLAHCGFEAHGVDVEPVFAALYSEPGDTGVHGPGSVAIHTGRWPAEERLRMAVGDGFSLITSKNTLKNGYLHPAPPPGKTVDPKKLVQLGVSDEEFVARVHGALHPGGLFLIYNICPAQNPPDGEYLPYADGTCPFPRALLEREGFEVIAFDALDQEWVLDCFTALGYDEGKPRDELAKNYFCWYTLVRRR